MKKFNLNEIISNIKSLRNTERGKAILFFAFYAIFFFVIFLMARFGNHPQSILDTELKRDEKYSINSILGDNYNYTYSVIIDNNEYIYMGSKNDSVESFTYKGDTYYRNGVNFFTYKNGLWIKVDNPYVYEKFLNIYDLQKIIVDGTLISDSNKLSAKYLISTASIVKADEGINIDIEEVPNSMIQYANKSGKINKIELDLTSYGKYKKICSTKFVVVLNYSDFGEVGEITNPVD